MTDQLAGAKLKANWAEQHVKNFAVELKAFVESNPLHMVREDDDEAGQHFWKVYGLKALPDHWPCMIGDCIHNLRSALDILICDLIRAEGNTVSSNNAFPISRTREKSIEAIASTVHGVSKSAQRLVRALKPYKCGNEILWAIHRLDILDKHQLIIPVAVAHAYVQMSVQPPSVGDFKPPPVWINIPAQGDAVKNGDVVFSAPIDELNYDIRCAFQVVFGEIEVVAREGVIPTLNKIGAYIDKIIKIADRKVIGN